MSRSLRAQCVNSASSDLRRGVAFFQHFPLRLIHLHSILSLCLVFGCKTGEEEEAPVLPASGPVSSSFYQRYTGTLGDKQIVLQLHASPERTYGMYYDQAVGDPIPIVSGEIEGATNNLVFFEPEADSTTWRVTVDQGGIRGNWYGHGETREISLTPASTSLRLMPFEAQDSSYASGVEGPIALVSHQLYLPATAQIRERDLVESAMLTMLGCDSSKDADLKQCLDRQRTDFYKFHKENISASPETADAWTRNYFLGHSMVVAYNDNDLLIFGIRSDHYTGGIHENFSTMFVNLDLREERIWELADVIAVDSNILDPMIEAELRQSRSLAGAQNVDIIADKVRYTENIYLTDKGITFVYAPYELMAWSEGEVQVFIPFSQLKASLRPEFVQRLGISWN